MEPAVLPGILRTLKENHPTKYIEALYELQNSPESSDILTSAEELIFNEPMNFQLPRKFSTPSMFFSQSSFNDILSTSPQFQLPRQTQLAMNAIDKVVIESLVLAKPKSSHHIPQNESGNVMASRTNSALQTPQVNSIKVATPICAFTPDHSNPHAMESFTTKRNSDQLNLNFCHSWWMSNPEESSVPLESKSSHKLRPSASRSASRSHIGTSSSRSNAHAKRDSSYHATNKFCAEEEPLHLTPSPSQMNLQTVKIMVNENELGSDEDGNKEAGNSKLPNTHRKGQPPETQKHTRPGRGLSARSSRLPNHRTSRFYKNGLHHGHKKAPKK